MIYSPSSSEENRYEQTAYAIKAMAHPQRLKIVLLLSRQQELSVSQLLEELPIGQSLLSHHLKGMREKGVLGQRRQGKHIFYHLRDKTMGDYLRQLYTSMVVG